MLRTVLALTLFLVASGCCSSRLGSTESESCRQYRAGKDEARLGWANARDPNWPVQTQPTLDTALRVGMTAKEVREQLGRPAEVTSEEEAEEWTYAMEEATPLVVRFREGKVVEWERQDRRDG